HDGRRDLRRLRLHDPVDPPEPVARPLLLRRDLADDRRRRRARPLAAGRRPPNHSPLRGPRGEPRSSHPRAERLMDILLFGPPGAGKGTQAKLLTEELRAPQIATGDMMRAERQSGSELGKKFDEYMSAGKLVPDDLVIELIRKRLSQDDAKGGAIFDGFPRTVPQAEALDALLASMGRQIDRVIALDVPLSAIVERV